MAQHFKESDLQHTPEEFEFFAEDEEVTIVPYFLLSTQDSKVLCVQGEVGPFQPNFPVKVPLWLAIFLYEKKQCRIEPPEWLSVENLQDVYEQERAQGEFQPMPFQYLEVAHALLTRAKDCFSARHRLEARDLVEQIRRLRTSKVNTGMQGVRSAVTAKMNNICAMELNTVRPFFLGTLERFYQMEKMNDVGQPAANTDD